MEDFKQYLSEDADDREREAAKQVLEGLAGLRIENKVSEVAAERRVWLRRRFWVRLVSVAALVVIAGGIFLFFIKKEIPANESPLLKPLPEQTPQLQQRQPIPPGAIEPSQKKPIAKRPLNPTEQAEQPLLRNVKPDADPETTQLINTLLRITLNTDSIHLLDQTLKGKGWRKIVESLRENNYLEAKAGILDFCNLMVDRECNWLMGIALLEEGRPDDALLIFERIAKDPNHHRFKEAKMVMEALR